MQAEATRQIGLDWLRIGAFVLLILYHIGMFVGPWPWHINAAAPASWLQWPMMAVNPWRLALLFVISGVASRALMGKLGGSRAFARSRSYRLLLPLGFGMAIIVVPQPWAELRDQGSYTQGLLHFWLHDYFEFGGSRGTPLPTWNHLWFVAYLWVYSMLLAIGGLAPASVRAGVAALVGRCFSGWRLFVLPVLWLALARALLLPVFGETHALFDDPYAHAVYGLCFFAGVLLGVPGPLWSLADRRWRALIVVAGLACAARIGLAALVPTDDLAHLRALVWACACWSAVLGLLGFARAHLNIDAPLRRSLSRAIFPCYVVHQSAIVLAGYGTKQLELAGIPAFFFVLVMTLAACIGTLIVARCVPALRPLIGLPARSAGAAMPVLPVTKPA